VPLRTLSKIKRLVVKAELKMKGKHQEIMYSGRIDAMRDIYIDCGYLA